MQRSKRGVLRRDGFTLVELLVVIGIIGTLVGLLLPAVVNTRGQSRQAYCMNNLKQISMAALTRATNSSRGTLPGYLEKLRLEKPAPTELVPMFGGMTEYDIQVSWAATLLTNLDRAALADDLRRNTGIDYHRPPRIDIFTCASNPTTDDSLAALDYVANTGGTDGNCATADSRANGLFHNLVNYDTRVRYPEDIRDGTSSTMMFSENSHKNPEVATWLTWSEPGADSHEYVEQVFGMVWLPTVEQPAREVQEPMSVDRSADSVYSHSPAVPTRYTRPASNHPGIVMAGYADGSVRATSTDMAYSVYQRLLTPDGRHCVDSLNMDANPQPDAILVLRDLPTLGDDDF